MVGNLQSNLQYYCFLAFACICLQDLMFICEIEIHFIRLRLRFVGAPRRRDADLHRYRPAFADLSFGIVSLTNVTLCSC